MSVASWLSWIESRPLAQRAADSGFRGGRKRKSSKLQEHVGKQIIHPKIGIGHSL